MGSGLQVAATILVSFLAHIDHVPQGVWRLLLRAAQASWKSLRKAWSSSAASGRPDVSALDLTPVVRILQWSRATGCGSSSLCLNIGP